MIYRVFDKKEKRWVIDNVYMKPNGKLFKIKKIIFKWFNIPFELSQDKYILHEHIGLYDKLNEKIFIGDFVKAQVSEDKVVIGLVVFAPELASYIILCDDTSEWYSLGSEVSKHIQVIGNTFDGYGNNEE